MSSQKNSLTIILSDELSDALDRAIEAGDAGSTPEEALIHGFREWAAGRGYLAGNQEGLRPDELNAANDD